MKSAVLTRSACRQAAPCSRRAAVVPLCRVGVVVRCSSAEQQPAQHARSVATRAAATAEAAPVAGKPAAPHPKQVCAELDVPKGSPNRKIVIAQVAPAVRVAIAETCGLDPGATTPGQLAEALRRLGFDFVFDTLFAADLTIMEEATELLHRLKHHLEDHPAADEPLPMFTSCCPGWIGMMEKSYPELIPYVSSCKSPQMMMGAVVKTFFAAEHNVKPEDIVMVSIMPCVRKQGEADREWMAANEGVRDVDHVLTTTELGAIFKERGLALQELPEGQYDSPLGSGSGGAVLFGTTGGVMEAALRTAFEAVTETKLERLNLSEVRGMDGIKEASVTLKPPAESNLAKLLAAAAAAKAKAAAKEGGEKKPIKWEGMVTEDGALTLRVAVANGLGNAKKLITKMQAGESAYDFVEIMACPGGCVSGGGQPRSADKQVATKRQQALYALDERSTVRRSHENPEIQALYKAFFGEPLSHKAHELLHTHYVAGGVEAAE